MLTQEQKLALRLKQLIELSGLHTVQIYVNEKGEIEFWTVDTKAVEGGKMQSSDTVKPARNP